MATVKQNLQKIMSAVRGADVRQAIHDSIDQCYKDATGNPESSARLANELRNEENTRRTADLQLQNEIENQAARITNLASLNSGSTTGDAELIDARVGHDGQVYESAGEAVRNQISDLHGICDVGLISSTGINIFRSSEISDVKAFSGTMTESNGAYKFTSGSTSYGRLDFTVVNNSLRSDEDKYFLLVMNVTAHSVFTKAHPVIYCYDSNNKNLGTLTITNATITIK